MNNQLLYVNQVTTLCNKGFTFNLLILLIIITVKGLSGAGVFYISNDDSGRK